MEVTPLKGINFKQNSSGEINTGIHVSTFLDEVKNLANAKGWVNIKIKPFIKPSEKGYTHKAILNERKAVEDNGSKI